MKTLKKSLLIVITLSFICSCSNDNIVDEDSLLTIESLLGAWKLTAISMNGESSELTKCDLSDLIIFDETKLMYVYNKGGDGNKCSIQTLKKDYTVRDNIITQEDGTEITIHQIFSVEPSSLILEYEDSYDDTVVVYRETYIKK